ncbi:hypothetical protein Taro_056186 [Colocasia esculenta]|uniref:Uncharacterized protein n=1 Tax=Colocasia esculenta TaxID=4460 RepID=A0A843XVG1_COLES|nr:hypothetical protein [Colocasia esculenta]
MISPQFIHLVPLSKWVISKCKDKSVDHREIAKDVAKCLCGVVLFPSGDHLIDYASLSAISGRPWERPGRSFRGIQQVTDRTVWVREQLDDWERRGKEVVSEATSDEYYYRAYARRYGAQVYKGTRRSLDPEGRISSLEGILHSTIQQRDDLQAVVDQLRAELDRAQQMVGGASSSREDPGRSVLEGQLASATARAEDALAQLREREQELRTALARTTTLEVEMAELRLPPEAVEVARWRQEAEAAARWQQEAAEVT